MEQNKELSTDKQCDVHGIISRLFIVAEKIYGNEKYDRFSIQNIYGTIKLIGHEEIPYESDIEHELCDVADFINGL